MPQSVRSGMHTPHRQIVVVVMRQRDPAYQHSDHPAHIAKLSEDVAEYAKNVGKRDLRDLALDQEAAVLEEVGAEKGSEQADQH